MKRTIIYIIVLIVAVLPAYPQEEAATLRPVTSAYTAEIGDASLYAQYVVLIMVSCIESRHVVFSRFENDKYFISAGKFTEECAPLFIIYTKDIRIKPHLTAAESGGPFLFQSKPEGGIYYMKRFAVTGVTRDKEYDVTQGLCLL